MKGENMHFTIDRSRKRHWFYEVARMSILSCKDFLYLEKTAVQLQFSSNLRFIAFF